MDKIRIEREYPDFVKEVQGLAADALKQRIVILQQSLQESEDHREANEELKAMKDAVSELSGPYRDVRKAVKAKTQYILSLLQDN